MGGMSPPQFVGCSPFTLSKNKLFCGFSRSRYEGAEAQPADFVVVNMVYTSVVSKSGGRLIAPWEWHKLPEHVVRKTSTAQSGMRSALGLPLVGSLALPCESAPVPPKDDSVGPKVSWAKLELESPVPWDGPVAVD